MQRTHGRGRELLNLTYLNDDEMMKLYGEPTQGANLVDYKKLGAKQQKDKEKTGLNYYRMNSVNNKKTKTCCHSYVISHDNKIKAIWDFVLLLLIAYSCTTTTYYVVFSSPEDSAMVIIELIIDIMFILDIIMKFFHAFKDPESLEVESDCRKIAWAYLTSWFIIDLLAGFPFNVFSANKDTKDNLLAIKLLRVFRMPQFFGLLNSSKFDTFMEKILEKESTNPREEKSRQEKMMIKYIARYTYKVFRLIFIALMLTYFLGCGWYFIVKAFEDSQIIDSFHEAYKLEQYTEFERMIICCYFVLTTLSTVGYGDMSPQTNTEKIIGISLMIVGIAFFSYIMGNFNDVLVNYDNKMGIIDRRSDLQVWMTSLNKFNKAQDRIPKDMIQNMNDHFEFFWKHDRLSSLTPDDTYLQTMPVPLRIQLMNFLFDDIFVQFRAFMSKKKFKNSPFYYEIAFLFKPRRYEKDEVIVKKGDRFEEIFFLLQGEICCSMDTDEGTIKRFFKKGYFFGDYSVLYDTPAYYDYTANVPVNLLALPKYEFIKILSKYKEIEDKIKETSIFYRGQSRKRYFRMFKKMVEDKVKDGTLKQGMGEYQMNAKFGRYLIPKKDIMDQMEEKKYKVIFSEKKLNKIEGKLNQTEKNLSKFSTSMKGFCNLMEKELNDITRKLEDLKTSILEQDIGLLSIDKN